LSTAKVLTVRQPWASAIIYAGKDVENRSWPTKHRGRLYIHAGMTREADDILPPGTPVPQGAIIGYVTVTGCVRDSASPWAIPGNWHWLLTDPVPLPEPIPARGRLSLWQPPPTWTNGDPGRPASK
jgi:ASCH domain